MWKPIKFGFSILALAIALFPVWIYLIANATFDPQGFWQEFILFGTGVWLLGGAQIVLLVLFFYILPSIWTD